MFINSNVNMISQFSRGVAMCNKDGDILQIFPSRMEASRWLQQNHKTTGKKAESIAGRIGQVCNGKRKTAYGYKWKDVK